MLSKVAQGLAEGLALVSIKTFDVVYGIAHRAQDAGQHTVMKVKTDMTPLFSGSI